MRSLAVICCISVLMIAAACRAKQEGALEGAVVPAHSIARITAMREGGVVAAVKASDDGTFRMTLPAGKYEVHVETAAAPYPMTFPGIVVEPGKTTTMPPIVLNRLVGSAVISGKIQPNGPGVNVTLLYEGRERASIDAGPEGAYEFSGLPAGTYGIRASRPGYAADGVSLDLLDNQKAMRNIRLLYESPIEGVDWTEGTVRVTGLGLPPTKSPTVSVRREMAKRAAVADALRKALKAIEQLKVGPDRSLRIFLGDAAYSERIRGFVQTYNITSERDRGDGGVEVDLELPLTGQSGLARSLTD